jgi:hypothetical protein
MTSLIIEKNTSLFLGALLGIKDFASSRTLGNASSSLSFNAKIDLLIDIGALDAQKRNLFQTFMELRNQLMHNLDANTYESCISFMKGKEGYLLKKYKPDTSLTKEEQLKSCIENLSSDVEQITLNILDKVKERKKRQAELEIYEVSHKAYLSYFNTPRDAMNKYFDEQVAINQVFNSDRLRDIAFYVINSIHEHWMEAIKKT